MLSATPPGQESRQLHCNQYERAARKSNMIKRGAFLSRAASASRAGVQRHSSSERVSDGLWGNERGIRTSNHGAEITTDFATTRGSTNTF